MADTGESLKVGDRLVLSRSDDPGSPARTGTVRRIGHTTVTVDLPRGGSMSPEPSGFRSLWKPLPLQEFTSPKTSAYTVHVSVDGKHRPVVLQAGVNTTVADIITSVCIRARPHGPWPARAHALCVDTSRHRGAPEVLPYSDLVLGRAPGLRGAVLGSDIFVRIAQDPGVSIVPQQAAAPPPPQPPPSPPPKPPAAHFSAPPPPAPPAQPRARESAAAAPRQHSHEYHYSAAVAPEPPASAASPHHDGSPVASPRRTPYLGLEVVDTRDGVRISKATGPAAAAGLVQGDYVHAVAGRSISSADGIRRVLLSLPWGFQDGELPTERVEVITSSGARSSSHATKRSHMIIVDPHHPGAWADGKAQGQCAKLCGQCRKVCGWILIEAFISLAVVVVFLPCMYDSTPAWFDWVPVFGQCREEVLLGARIGFLSTHLTFFLCAWVLLHMMRNSIDQRMVDDEASVIRRVVIVAVLMVALLVLHLIFGGPQALLIGCATSLLAIPPCCCKAGGSLWARYVCTSEQDADDDALLEEEQQRLNPEANGGPVYHGQRGPSPLGDAYQRPYSPSAGDRGAMQHLQAMQMTSSSRGGRPPPIRTTFSPAPGRGGSPAY